MFAGYATIGNDFAVYVSQANGVQIPNSVGANSVASAAYSILGALTNPAFSSTLITAANGAQTGITTANSGNIPGLRLNINSGNHTFNSNVDTMTLNTGGLLITAGTQTLQGGRITAGNASVSIGAGAAQNTALSSNTLYVNAVNILSLQAQVIDDGYQPLNVVKTLGSAVNFGTNPILQIGSETASGAGVPGTASTPVQQGTNAPTTNLVAGMIQTSVTGGVPVNSIITTINNATTYAVNTVTTASASGANTGYALPTSSVLTNSTLSTGSNVVTLPLGSVVYPGSTVTVATGTTGTLAANTTVLAYNPANGQATLSANPTGNSTGATATLLFSPFNSAATATAIIPSGFAASAVSGSNTVTLSSGVNSLMVGAAVTGTGIAAGSTIVAVNSPTSITLSLPTTGSVSSLTSITTPAAILSAQSLVTSTTSGSSTAVIIAPSAAAPSIFLGQQITGPGIAYGTTVQGFTPIAGSTNFSVTLSQPALAGGVANEFFSLGPVGSAMVVPTIAASCRHRPVAGGLGERHERRRGPASRSTRSSAPFPAPR